MRFKNIAQGLTIVSFVLICWVGNRALRPRAQCLNSSFISFVQIDKTRVQNCVFESRLSLHSVAHPLTDEELKTVRALEVLEPLVDIYPEKKPRIAVQVVTDDPKAFEVDRGLVRLGSDWLNDKLQTKRALIMGLLKRTDPVKYNNSFELETITDFLMMNSMNEKQDADIKFSTSVPSFADYCKSPMRSLAHYSACTEKDPDSSDMEDKVWGFRPALAAGISHVFSKLGLGDKLKVLNAIATGSVLSEPRTLHEASVSGMSSWFESTLRDQFQAFGVSDVDMPVKRTLKELEVEAPTHWELTVDLTATPAWKEILEQLRTYAQFRKNERTLVFTPQGEVALPSGLPVAWNKDEIQSQTHVMIACQWPKPGEAINVQARHIFARQTCGKVDQVFWN